MLGFRTPVFLVLYCGLLESVDICRGDRICDKGHIPILLGLEECSPENCHGTCTTGTNPLGYVLDICCTDQSKYTCYNQSNLNGLRLACFNATSENDTDCEAFDVNVHCVAELYNKTFEECRVQYLDLYQRFFTVDNDFDPNNCPCETGYIKNNQPCPCTDNQDNCGIDMGHADICCFKSSYLDQESPCSSEERYITLDYGKCIRKTCKGRCENMTAYGKTDKQVCCISPDDLRVVGGSDQSGEGSSAGAIVGGLIAVLIAGAIITVLLVYLRKTGRCSRLRLRRQKRRKKTEYDDIQMQTRLGNEDSRKNGAYTNV